MKFDRNLPPIMWLLFCLFASLFTICTYAIVQTSKLTMEKHHLQTTQEKMQQETQYIKQDLKNFHPEKIQLDKTRTEANLSQEQSNILENINTALESCGAVLNSLQPLHNSWQIEIKGNYQDFWRFLKTLNSSNSATFAILHLKISSTENAPNAALLMQLEANYQAYKHTETLPSDATLRNEVLSDPFRKSTSTENPDQETALSTWPISCLNLTGTLIKNQQTLAIISDPNGNIYSIRPGDKIGREKKSIQSVKVDKITFNDKEEISFKSL
ncbi:MAG: pilus assembly protein PilP [Gammaproteobacteria bacterium]